jgi:plastocyanin
VNRVRVAGLIFISISLLSCSSLDKKVQNNPVEKKSTPLIKQNEVAKEPEITENIKVEEAPVIKVEQPKKITPKKEMIETTPPVQKISEAKVETKEFKKPVVKKPVVKKPKVKQTLTIKGKVNLNDSKTDANISSTVVYYTPKEGEYSVEAKSEFKISTKNKRFEPNVLVIPVGSEVSFPNLDRILHNVFSVSGKSEFDLGLYSAGTVKSVKFDRPGVIYVHCNVHHSMQADILVVDTPWYTNVNDDGSFSLENIPNKPGTLHVWHPRSNLKKLNVNNNQVNAFDIDLDITRKKVPKHLNKLGKSYRPKERY